MDKIDNTDPYLVAAALAMATQEKGLTEEQESILTSRYMFR
nr:MAG TPA: hypothetical protein [Caudoviricetes sp.]